MKTKVNNIVERKQTSYVVKSTEDVVMIKDVDLDKRIVTGVYNTFNFYDTDYDVITPGAAQKSINERGPESSSVVKIKHLLFHDWTKLPGKIETLAERQVVINNKKVKGIYFETKMADTQMGTDTLINYQENVYDNHSIGFQFLDGQWIDAEAEGWKQFLDTLINPEKADENGFAYVWKEIKLYEGSTVAFGANELTPYLGVKDLTNKNALVLKLSTRITTLQNQVRKGQQSDDMLESFEMQLLQLKQLLNELFIKGPSAKPTPTKGPGKKDADDMMTCDSCGNDFDAGQMEANDDGSYNCPNCNQLCMPKSGSFLSNLQFV